MFVNRSLSSGGSYFYIIQQYIQHDKTFQTICNFADFFNGFYLVCCPLVNKCSKIIVERRFREFHGFMSPGNILQNLSKLDNVVIWNNEVCSTIAPKVNLIIRWEIKDKHEAQKAGCKTVYIGEGQFHIPSDTEVCTSLNQFTHVIMVGASHVFFIHQYLKSICPFNPKLQILHVPTKYISDTRTQALAAISRYSNVSKPITLIIQTGSYNVKYSPTYITLVHT